jgi:hypothetical protein
MEGYVHGSSRQRRHHCWAAGDHETIGIRAHDGPDSRAGHWHLREAMMQINKVWCWIRWSSTLEGNGVDRPLDFGETVVLAREPKGSEH